MSVVTPVNPPQLPHRSPPPPTNAWPSPNTASAGVPTLSEGVRVRLLHAAHGDPRAAAELAAALTPRQLTGLDPLPAEPLALAPALLRTHRREVRALPDDTRFLLLLAAADQYPVPTHAYARAVTAAGLDTRPLDTADRQAVTAILSGREADRLVLALAVGETTEAARRDARAAWRSR